MKDAEPESVLSPKPSKGVYKLDFCSMQDVKEKVACQKGRRISKSVPLAL